ncbi:MAG: phosphoesterase RecJ domain-containing protein, partial [Clostridiales bacterium]|nr:phosphoesterase RecJ domain-containing protein [Clostridiales bacterium]
MTISPTQAAEFLSAHDRYLILTHVRPDGDTVGCAAALCRALRTLGKTAHDLPNPEITPLFSPYLEGLLAPEDLLPDTVVSVDMAARSLFPDNALPYLPRVDLAIDHHPSQEFFARETCLDAGRAACGELIYDILRELGPITPAMAIPLYVAVSTDTGCFQYSNTTADTHRVAAALMDTGIDVFPLNKRHFRTKSWARLQVERLLTERMHRYEGGKIAVAPVSLSLMDEAGATEEDMEDIAAFLGQIEGVETSVTIRELAEGGCKLSVRTSGGLHA